MKSSQTSGWLDNFNESSVSLPQEYVGEGLFNGPIFDNGAKNGPAQRGKKIVKESTSVRLPKINAKELKNIVSDKKAYDENRGEILKPKAEANKVERFLPDQETKDFFNKYEKTFGLAAKQNLLTMQMKYGNPSVRKNDKSIVSRVSGRSNYDPGLNRINIVDETAHLDAGRSGYLEELTHAAQFNDIPGVEGFPDIPTFITKDVPAYIRGWREPDNKKARKIDQYGTKGTFENKAHYVIQPQLEEEASTTWKTMYPEDEKEFYRTFPQRKEEGGIIPIAQNGTSFPRATGNMYARTGAPSNGKYAKKTLPSAEEGGVAEYDPDTNPEFKWNGAGERVLRAQLENYKKSGNKRGIEKNQGILDRYEAFKASEKKYRENSKALVENYSLKEKSIRDLAETAKRDYNIDLNLSNNKLDSRKIISQNMINRANSVTASGKGYPLLQAPQEENTCMNGVCTAASQAGVDFSALAGKTGVVSFKGGKDIPQYNPTWTEDDNYLKVGYERVPEGELPQEGDLAQYETARDKTHEDTKHIELVKELIPGGYKSFNNYKQTNNPQPGTGNAVRTFVNGDPGTVKEFEDFPATYYFRLNNDAADKIVNTDPQYKPIVEGYKKYKESDVGKKLQEDKDFMDVNKPEYDKARKFYNGQMKNIWREGGTIPSAKEGKIVQDNNGYWDPKNWGNPVEIDSNNITMEGVYEPLIGVSDTGDVQFMTPRNKYKYRGKKVTEYPIAKNGVNLQDEKTKEHLDQLTNFTNYNKPTKGGWLEQFN